MNLHGLLQELGILAENARRVRNAEGVSRLSAEFEQVLQRFVNQHAINVSDRLLGLQHALQLYGDLIPQLPSGAEVEKWGHGLFMTSARLVLGADFSKLNGNDLPVNSFKSTLTVLYNRLQNHAVGHYFLVLQWLLVHLWNHPTLVQMMKGEEDIDRQRALTYLRSGEYPELIRLRVDMLAEGGLLVYSLNLCNWCLQSPSFQDDISLRLTQLLLLHKLSRQEEFHNQCWQVSCCQGVQIMEQLSRHPEVADNQAVSLMLAQTFLLQDWMKPAKYCCTQKLLDMWLNIQRKVEPDTDQFLQSISKVAQLAQCSQQLNKMTTALYTQFGKEFLQLSTELCVSALKMDRSCMQSAKAQKVDSDLDAAVDGLVGTSQLTARIYEGHPEVQLASYLTALYLKPSVDSFQRTITLKENNEIRPEIICPPVVHPNTLTELLQMLNSLRPVSLNLSIDTNTMREQCLKIMSQAGLSLPPANQFKVPAYYPPAVSTPEAHAKSNPDSSKGATENREAELSSKPGAEQVEDNTTAVKKTEGEPVEEVDQPSVSNQKEQGDEDNNNEEKEKPKESDDDNDIVFNVKVPKSVSTDETISQGEATSEVKETTAGNEQGMNSATEGVEVSVNEPQTKTESIPASVLPSFGTMPFSNHTQVIPMQSPLPIPGLVRPSISHSFPTSTPNIWNVAQQVGASSQMGPRLPFMPVNYPTGEMSRTPFSAALQTMMSQDKVGRPMEHMMVSPGSAPNPGMFVSSQLPVVPGPKQKKSPMPLPPQLPIIPQPPPAEIEPPTTAQDSSLDILSQAFLQSGLSTLSETASTVGPMTTTDDMTKTNTSVPYSQSAPDGRLSQEQFGRSQNWTRPSSSYAAPPADPTPQLPVTSSSETTTASEVDSMTPEAVAQILSMIANSGSQQNQGPPNSVPQQPPPQRMPPPGRVAAERYNTTPGPVPNPPWNIPPPTHTTPSPRQPSMSRQSAFPKPETTRKEDNPSTVSFPNIVDALLTDNVYKMQDNPAASTPSVPYPHGMPAIPYGLPPLDPDKKKRRRRSRGQRKSEMSDGGMMDNMQASPGLPQQVNPYMCAMEQTAAKNAVTPNSEFCSDLPPISSMLFTSMASNDPLDGAKSGGLPSMSKFLSTPAGQMEAAHKWSDVSSLPKETVVSPGSIPIQQPNLGVTSPLQREKFPCIHCNKEFPTVAERRKHQEWMCPKRRMSLPGMLGVPSVPPAQPPGIPGQPYKKPRRRRRTRAEMEAARAAGEKPGRPQFRKPRVTPEVIPMPPQPIDPLRDIPDYPDDLPPEVIARQWRPPGMPTMPQNIQRSRSVDEAALHAEPTIPKRPKAYKCYFCNGFFDSRHHLNKHREKCKIETKLSNPYVCSYCGMEFPSMPSLNGHLLSKHRGGLAEGTPSLLCQRINIKDMLVLKVIKFICTCCINLFDNMQLWEEHKKDCMAEAVCDRYYEFKCMFCNMAFESRNRAYTHCKSRCELYKQHIHEEEKNAWRCKLCKVVFPSSNDLNAHLLTKHTKFGKDGQDTRARETDKIVNASDESAAAVQSIAAPNLQTEGPVDECPETELATVNIITTPGVDGEVILHAEETDYDPNVTAAHVDDIVANVASGKIVEEPILTETIITMEDSDMLQSPYMHMAADGTHKVITMNQNIDLNSNRIPSQSVPMKTMPQPLPEVPGMPVSSSSERVRVESMELDHDNYMYKCSRCQLTFLTESLKNQHEKYNCFVPYSSPYDTPETTELVAQTTAEQSYSVVVTQPQLTHSELGHEEMNQTAPGQVDLVVEVEGADQMSQAELGQVIKAVEEMTRANADVSREHTNSETDSAPETTQEVYLQIKPDQGENGESSTYYVSTQSSVGDVAVRYVQEEVMNEGVVPEMVDVPQTAEITQETAAHRDQIDASTAQSQAGLVTEEASDTVSTDNPELSGQNAAVTETSVVTDSGSCTIQAVTVKGVEHQVQHDLNARLGHLIETHMKDTEIVSQETMKCEVELEEKATHIVVKPDAESEECSVPDIEVAEECAVPDVIEETMTADETCENNQEEFSASHVLEIGSEVEKVRRNISRMKQEVESVLSDMLDTLDPPQTITELKESKDESNYKQINEISQSTGIHPDGKDRNVNQLDSETQVKTERSPSDDIKSSVKPEDKGGVSDERSENTEKPTNVSDKSEGMKHVDSEQPETKTTATLSRDIPDIKTNVSLEDVPKISSSAEILETKSNISSSVDVPAKKPKSGWFMLPVSGVRPTYESCPKVKHCKHDQHCKHQHDSEDTVQRTSPVEKKLDSPDTEVEKIMSQASNEHLLLSDCSSDTSSVDKSSSEVHTKSDSSSENSNLVSSEIVRKSCDVNQMRSEDARYSESDTPNVSSDLSGNNSIGNIRSTCEPLGQNNSTVDGLTFSKTSTEPEKPDNKSSHKVKHHENSESKVMDCDQTKEHSVKNSTTQGISVEQQKVEETIKMENNNMENKPVTISENIVHTYHSEIHVPPMLTTELKPVSPAPISSDGATLSCLRLGPTVVHFSRTSPVKVVRERKPRISKDAALVKIITAENEVDDVCKMAGYQRLKSPPNPPAKFIRTDVVKSANSHPGKAKARRGHPALGYARRTMGSTRADSRGHPALGYANRTTGAPRADRPLFVHTDTELICRHCDFPRVFSKRFSLLCHMKWVHGVETEPLGNTRRSGPISPSFVTTGSDLSDSELSAALRVAGELLSSKKLTVKLRRVDKELSESDGVVAKKSKTDNVEYTKLKQPKTVIPVSPPGLECDNNNVKNFATANENSANSEASVTNVNKIVYSSCSSDNVSMQEPVPGVTAVQAIQVVAGTSTTSQGGTSRLIKEGKVGPTPSTVEPHVQKYLSRIAKVEPHYTRHAKRETSRPAASHSSKSKSSTKSVNNVCAITNKLSSQAKNRSTNNMKNNISLPLRGSSNVLSMHNVKRKSSLNPKQSITRTKLSVKELTKRRISAKKEERAAAQQDTPNDSQGKSLWSQSPNGLVNKARKQAKGNKPSTGGSKALGE